MRLLCLNAGSSSLKFALFDAGGDDAVPILRGSVAGLGDAAPRLAWRTVDGASGARGSLAGPLSPVAACDAAFAVLDAARVGGIDAVVHRIVHGGDRYTRATRLDAAVLRVLHGYVSLAPLHQPHNLAIVDAAAARLPGTPQLGSFDTAFHAGRPRVDRLYAIPRALTDGGIIGYGFHGLSYSHVADELRRIDGDRAGGRAIAAHLGSGASLCAMQRGDSIATTMGFSALDGLPMATRCGAIDPGVLLYLQRERGFDAEGLARLLHAESGLLGVSGLSGDMQVLLASEAPAAREAVDLFVHRTVQAIGAMAAALGGLDTLVFTAGIGEHARAIRERIAARLEWLGVGLDAARNRAGERSIGADGSRVEVLVIPADEERAMARDARACLVGHR